MDREIERQMQEVLLSVEQAEVVCVIFPHFAQCLVFDSRSTAEDPPRMTVSPLLGSAERWLHQLNQARPHLPRAQGIVAIPWAYSVASMAGSAIWTRLVGRMVDSGFRSTVPACQEALDELLGWEHRANVDMVRGRGPFYTLWSAAHETR